jgi:rare lipoprotein A
MKNIQVKNLKLNVTNIKSFLINSNKNLKKLRAEKNLLVVKGEKEERFREKEKRIESPLKANSPISKVKNVLLAGPMSIFDKIKEFLGIIFLGILVNNLPKIIQSIKNFFNDPFVKGMLKVFEYMGKGLYEIIKAVIQFPESVQKRIKDDVENIKEKIDFLLSSFGFLEKDIDTKLKDANQNRSSSRSRSQPAPKPTSVPLTQSGAPQNPTPQTAFQPGSSPLAQAFSKGGTVKKPKIRKFARGGTVTNENRPRQNTRTTSFAKKETAKARKARQDVNYFEGFNRAITDLVSNTLLDDKNNTLYEEMVNNFKKLGDLLGIEKDSIPPGPGPSPGPNGMDLAIEVDPQDVIGTVGYTGRVVPAGPGGSHIHIENEKNYQSGIPTNIKNNILINGLPMPQRLRFTSGIGQRWGKTHKGEDYAGDPNQPITLTGGLKFVSFIPDQGGGYGNRVIIQAPDGTRYSLSHLNSGPKDIQKLKQKQLQLQQQDAARFSPTGQKQSGEASWYGPGFQGRKTANGERFDTNQLTAAHPTLPFGSKVKVTNKSNGKSIIVRINDRGPYAVNSSGKAIYPLRPHPSRVIDLSKAAMDSLGGSGVINVELEILKEKPIPKPGSKDFIGPVPGSQDRKVSTLNNNVDNSDTMIAMVYNTQQIIQPYPMIVPMPIESSAPTQSPTPQIASAWKLA